MVPHAYAEVSREWEPEARTHEAPETVDAHREAAIPGIVSFLSLSYHVQ